MQKHVNLVDLVKSFPTNIYLQNLASIQKKTSPLKFAHLAEKSEKGSISNLSTKERADCQPSPRTHLRSYLRAFSRRRRGRRSPDSARALLYRPGVHHGRFPAAAHGAALHYLRDGARRPRRRREWPRAFGPGVHHSRFPAAANGAALNHLRVGARRE